MIRTFADAETARIWSEEGSRRLPTVIQQRALNKLALLNRATRLDDCETDVPPSGPVVARGIHRADGPHPVPARPGDRCAADTVTAILAGKRAVAADTGLRLDRYFGLSEGYWLGLQQDYDLRQAKRLLGPKLARIKPRVPATV